MRLRRPRKAHIYAGVAFRPDQRIKSALRLKDAWQEAKGLPNHAFYLLPSFAEGIDNRTETLKLKLLTLRSGKMNAADLRYVLLNANLIAQIAVYERALDVTWRWADLLFICEQLPNPQSRVSLVQESGPDGYPLARADWQLSGGDFDSMLAMYDLLVGGVSTATCSRRCTGAAISPGATRSRRRRTISVPAGWRAPPRRASLTPTSRCSARRTSMSATARSSVPPATPTRRSPTLRSACASPSTSAAGLATRRDRDRARGAPADDRPDRRLRLHRQQFRPPAGEPLRPSGRSAAGRG